MKYRLRPKNAAGFGYCYHNAMIMLEHHPNAWLVHGYPVLNAEPNKGRLFGHAWVEFRQYDVWWVLDHSRPRHPILRQEFYRIGQVDEDLLTRYTYDEAMAQQALYGHAGPWVDGPDGALFAEGV